MTNLFLILFVSATTTPPSFFLYVNNTGRDMYHIVARRKTLEVAAVAVGCLMRTNEMNDVELRNLLAKHQSAAEIVYHAQGWVIILDA